LTSSTGYAVPLTVKTSPTKPWLGKCLKNDLPHHSGCVARVAGGRELAQPVVEVLVDRDAVVEPTS
jgi:hypothetical protein